MTIQIALKLPDELVEAADEIVRQGAYTSRSDLARKAIEALVVTEQRRSIDDLYRSAYTAIPETDAEIEEAVALATRTIAEEPWDAWW